MKFVYKFLILCIFISCGPDPLQSRRLNGTSDVHTNATGNHFEVDCFCSAQYSPVCGVNNVTYSNACYASCAGVEYTNYACDHPSNCNENSSEVCGVNNGNYQTYDNECDMKSNEATLVSYGPCN